MSGGIKKYTATFLLTANNSCGIFLTTMKERLDMLTRKDFAAMAEIVKRVQDEAIRNQLIYDFSAWCKTQNPNFNVGRFISACHNEKD